MQAGVYKLQAPLVFLAVRCGWWQQKELLNVKRKRFTMHHCKGILVILRYNTPEVPIKEIILIFLIS